MKLPWVTNQQVSYCNVDECKTVISLKNEVAELEKRLKYEFDETLVSYSNLIDDLTKEKESLEAKLHDLRQLRQLDSEARERLTEQLNEALERNKELQICYKSHVNLLNLEEEITTKLTNKIMKMESILNRIHQIAKPFCDECKEFNELHKERDCMYCNYGKILDEISKYEELNGN